MRTVLPLCDATLVKVVRLTCDICSGIKVDSKMGNPMIVAGMSRQKSGEVDKRANTMTVGFSSLD